MLDAQTLTFADWPGNNRIESLKNLQDDDRVAMLFLFPGLDVFMRINGHGHISTSPDLLGRLIERGKHPKAAVVVTVEEALFHCGKAVNRARLWDPAALLDRNSLPTVGTVLVALAELHDVSASALDAKYQDAVKHDLY
jgi:predicted pyridoxine 5'-phosphate oxidase superfamily flavin-nucleotide-binding protein